MKHIELLPLHPGISDTKSREAYSGEYMPMMISDFHRIPMLPYIPHTIRNHIIVPSLTENRVSYADISTILRDKIHHQVMPMLILSLKARDYSPSALDDISSTQTTKVKTSKLLEALLQRIE